MAAVMPALDGLLERYPVLSRLWRAPQRVPFVPQVTSFDCGLAALAMTLGLYGRATTLDEVRAHAQVQPGLGTSAAALLDVGRAFGLVGRGVSIELEELPQLPCGSILHWSFNHFVVFEGMEGQGAVVVDPSLGRQRVSEAMLRRNCTGVALLFSPSHAFMTKAAPARPLRPYLRELLTLPVWPRIIAMSVVLQLLAAALPMLTALVVDRIVPLLDTSLLAVASAGLAMLVGFQIMASLVRGHLLLSLRRHFEVRLTTGFMDHLVSLPMRFFVERTSGDLLSRYTSASQLQQAVASGSLTILIDGAMMVAYLAALLLVQPTMGFVALCLSAAQALVVMVPYRRQVELSSEALRAAGRSHSAAQEVLQGAETLKLLGAERKAVERWTHRFVDAMRADLERGRIGVHQESYLAAIRYASPLVLLLLGTSLVLEGGLSFGVMLSAAALAGSFLSPFSSLLATILGFSGLQGHLGRLRDVLEAEPEQRADGARAAPVLRGGIEVRNLSFRYGPLTDLVLRDVSAVILPGQMVGVVGASGSGKSTFLSLLMGLAAPEAGQVLFDGVDLRDCDLVSLRRQVGCVPQRPFLFNATVRENIAIGHSEATLEDVQRVARLASIHDDIVRLPHGYATELSEGGTSISGGQRQRLALARALLGQPKVLVLDEATSALDNASEALVQKQLEQLGCTRIVCAHRLSTVRHADLIFVFEGGRIVEMGKYEELLEARGVFAALSGAAAQVEP